MKLISIVIPCYNEAKNVPYAFERLGAVLCTLDTQYDFEIICVNDGSHDTTMDALQAQADTFAYPVHIVHLFRNFGSTIAITAGLHHANGDAVWVLDADMQNPPEVLSEFIAQWQDGCEIVYGHRIQRERLSPLRKALTALYYKVFNALSEVHIPRGTSEFVLLDKSLVDIYKTFGEQDMFTKGLYAWMGGKAGFVPYTPEDRKFGTTSFSPMRLFTLAFQGLFGFSNIPLRFIAVVGASVSVLAFLYILVRLVHYTVWGNTVAGYESTLMIMLFFGGVQMMSIGLLGEYIGRIYQETKKRPRYIVKNIYSNGKKSGKKTL